MAGSFVAHAADRETETRTIGVIAPLTLGNAKFGEDIKNAVEIVTKQFNTNPAARHRYKVLIEDGKCGSGNAAISAANRLITIEKVDALVVGCSGEILQVSDIVEKNRVPTMVVFASHPKVKHLGPHIFRVFVDVDNDTPRLTEKMKSQGRSRIAIITEDLPFTMGIKDALMSDLAERVTATPDYSEGSNDFRSILLRVKATNPDALFLNAGSVETLGPLVKQVSELGIKVPLYSFAYASVPTFIKSHSQFAEGMIFVSAPHVDETSEAGKVFKAAYMKETGSPPHIPFVAATAYDGATALISALEQSGRSDPEQTINALLNYNADGVTGRIRFDDNGDAVGIHYHLRTLRNGEMVPVS
jgi:branched-chain amino acid transport system substrate-binding protein